MQGTLKKTESKNFFHLRRNEEMGAKIYQMQNEIEEMDRKHSLEVQIYQERLAALGKSHSPIKAKNPIVPSGSKQKISHYVLVLRQASLVSQARISFKTRQPLCLLPRNLLLPFMKKILYQRISPSDVILLRGPIHTIHSLSLNFIIVAVLLIYLDN